MKKPINKLFALFFISHLSIAIAGENTTPIIEINELANKSSTQLNIKDARALIKTIPGGASITDLEDVRKGRQSTWQDSLGYTPGVYIQDRFGSEEARVSIRGSALSRTFHSFGIKILQDGVPINYADGFFDMQTVDPNASSYVEVLRGPNASIYGATTLGGSINFVTPTGLNNPGTKIRAEAGSFAYRKIFSSTAGYSDFKDGGNLYDYYLAGSTTFQNGFRDHAEMENQKIIGNVGIKISNDLETRFYLSAVRSRTQLPGYLTKDELESDPSQASSFTTTGSTVGSTVAGVQPWRNKNNYRRDIDSQRISNKTTYINGNNTYEFALYAMNLELWHPIGTIVEQHAQTYGGHLKFTNVTDKNKLTLAYLPSYGTTDGTSKPTDNMGNSSGAATSDYTQTSTNHSFLIEDKYNLTSKTLLVAALQYDSARRKVSDIVPGATNFNRLYNQWSPRVGLIYNISNDNQIFGSISRNFEAPIIATAGNTTTARSAQSGVTYEIGSRGQAQWGDIAQKIKWDLTLFRANLKNEFQTMCLTNPNCETGAQTINVPNTIHQGIEFGGQAFLNNHLEVKTALLYSDFKFDDNEIYRNNKMPGFAPVLLRAEMLYHSGSEDRNSYPNFYAGPKIEYASRAPMDNTNSLYNDPFTIFGFKAGQNINKTWSWFLDVRNIADKKYAATTNINSNYAGNGGRAYYPGDGRSAYMGIEAKF
ncbi:TonB-dependent receptor [Candidatus Methylopumilus rimovensis]|uniref:TonB-dependent receptor n=1 Tax=Candidatus Methylopumilus rimovensis TaxID=2588535 RepID=A0AAE6FTR8_9PROT|nr:TonB-dependent receptor [Candidatus Methylopumilus rimovensis]QDD13821.1 TonB-dependent receptor [Candidatus Methylopumilus rimovensis]